jgi:hypothetical protein
MGNVQVTPDPDTYGMVVNLSTGEMNKVIYVSNMMEFHRKLMTRGIILTETHKVLQRILQQVRVKALYLINVRTNAIEKHIDALPLFLPLKGKIDYLYDMGRCETRLQTALTLMSEEMECGVVLTTPSPIYTDNQEEAIRERYRLVWDKQDVT